MNVEAGEGGHVWRQYGPTFKWNAISIPSAPKFGNEGFLLHDFSLSRIFWRSNCVSARNLSPEST